MKFEASTTVAIVSISATSLSENPDSSRKLNVAATGIGLPIPVDSMSRWSNRPSFARRVPFCHVCTRRKTPTAPPPRPRRFRQSQSLN